MSLPAPSKPKHHLPNTKSKQLDRHLPSPAKFKQIPHATDEKKQTLIENSYPITFDTKYNTKDINWNELHHLAITKGRFLSVKKTLETKYSSHLSNYTTASNTPNIPNLPSNILQFIEQIFSETNVVLSAHNLLHSHNSWETQVDNHENISIYYRKETDSQNEIHSIKTCFTSKCHPIELIAVINEFDLMKEIVTIIPMETKYLKQFTNLNKVIYNSINMWWPLKSRDAVAHVRAYDLLKEYDEVLIWGKSVEKVDGVEIPQVSKGTLRMEVTMAEGVIKPVILESGEVGTEVISVFNIDFKTFLPKTIVNWVTRTFAYYACKMIRDRTENLEGTTHQQRIKEKQIYKEWAQSFAEWKVEKMAKKSGSY